MKQLTIATLSLCALLLGACGSGGPVRRVSEPSANIQQLSVRADGSWSVDLRIDNFSSIPMRFDGISLAMTVGGEQAGTLQGRPGLSIGPETADVATVALVPTDRVGSCLRIAAVARSASVAERSSMATVSTPLLRTPVNGIRSWRSKVR